MMPRQMQIGNEGSIDRKKDFMTFRNASKQCIEARCQLTRCNSEIVAAEGWKVLHHVDTQDWFEA
jgi:hypothetical protein